MLFHKKEDDSRLPDLPSARVPFKSSINFPPIEEDEALDDEKHALPTFPDSPMHNKFSQVAIKEAVSQQSLRADDKTPKRFGVVEMEEWSPSGTREKDTDVLDDRDEITNGIPAFPEPRNLERMVLPPTEMRAPLIMAGQRTRNSGDVFVKLDKFHSAKKALAEIRDSLEEIDEMVRKIRETKMREEQELAAWEKDIMQTKARIQEIGESIFEKVE